MTNTSKKPIANADFSCARCRAPLGPSATLVPVEVTQPDGTKVEIMVCNPCFEILDMMELKREEEQGLTSVRNEYKEAWIVLQNEIELIEDTVLAVTLLKDDLRRGDIFCRHVPGISDGLLSIYLTEVSRPTTLVQISVPGPREIISPLSGAIISWLYYKGYHKTSVVVMDEGGNGLQFIQTSDGHVKIRVLSEWPAGRSN